MKPHIVKIEGHWYAYRDRFCYDIGAWPLCNARTFQSLAGLLQAAT